MKKHLSNRFIYALLLLFMWGGTAQAFDDRIVFIDLDKAFNDYYKTKLADAQLKDQAEEFNRERKELVTEYESLQAAFNKAREDAANTALAQEVRDEKRTEAEEKLVELREQESKIRRFDESRRKQLEEQGRRMRKRIVEEIKTNVRSYARSEGYSAVIDTSGQSLNGVEIVVYADTRVDITADILEQLNKGRQQAEGE